MPTVDGTITVTVCGVSAEFPCEFNYVHRPAERLSRWSGGGVAVAPAPAEAELESISVHGDPRTAGSRRMLGAALLLSLSDAQIAAIQEAIAEQHGD